MALFTPSPYHHDVVDHLAVRWFRPLALCCRFFYILVLLVLITLSPPSLLSLMLYVARYVSLPPPLFSYFVLFSALAARDQCVAFEHSVTSSVK